MLKGYERSSWNGKHLGLFFFTKGGWMVFNKQEYQRKWVRNRKKKYLSRLGPCVFCGSFNTQIHHIDPSKKNSHKIWSWSEERILSELKQCIPMCKKCHSLFHTYLRMKPIEHGTLHAYQRYGCRCVECRKSRSDYYWDHEENGGREEIRTLGRS